MSGEFNPDWVSHPGTTIIDALRERSVDSGKSISMLLADILASCSPEDLCASIRITAPVAVALAVAFGNSVEFWIARQANYDEDCKRLAITAALADQRALREVKPHTPISMILFCPKCGLQHIDRGEWATDRLHKTHLCVGEGARAGCGHKWRPSEEYTVGVTYDLEVMK